MGEGVLWLVAVAFFIWIVKRFPSWRRLRAIDGRWKPKHKALLDSFPEPGTAAWNTHDAKVRRLELAWEREREHHGR